MIKQSMKRITITFLTIFVGITITKAQLKVLSNGFVGIGINNSSASASLDVNGTMIIRDWTNIHIDYTGLAASPVIYPSQSWYLQLGKNDQRLGNIYTEGIHSPNYWVDSDRGYKQNINKIDSADILIERLTGNNYYFKESFKSKVPNGKMRQKLGELQYGLIAQEVQMVLPELVMEDSSSGKLSVNYIAIIPILIEAIKKQNTKIAALTTKVNGCCQKDNKYNITGGNDIINQADQLGILYQNTPNPFKDKTEIKYFITSKFNSGLMVIYNLNGQQIKSYNINDSGSNSIIINENELSPGSYYYTLIINGTEVDTKKMILYK